MSQCEVEARLLAALSRDVNALKTTVQLMGQKQTLQTERHDSIKASLQKHREQMEERLAQMAERLRQLENFRLSSVERASVIRHSTRFWPALLMLVLFAFCVGIFVDDQKVANAIKNKMTLSAPAP